ncbi:MAG: hypothetical protein KatS3mg008_0550 [Acidimicrobiales bacterium]|nr:MAG: hypothetical protein KatS3mg008_0550 [Acidimicrobiales bacterium]
MNGVAIYVFLAMASHVLPEADYSLLAVLWVTLFAAGNGVMQPLEQELARAVSERRARDVGVRPVVEKAAALGLGFTAFVTVGLSVSSPWVLPRLFDGRVEMLLVLVLGLFSFAVVHMARGLLASHGRFRDYGTLFAVEGLSRPVVGAVLAAAAVTTAGAWGVLAAGAPLLAAAVSLRDPRPLLDEGPAASWTELSKALGWLLVGIASMALIVNGGVVAVKALAGEEDRAAAGVFLNGLLIARSPLFLFQAVLASLLPRLSHMVGSERWDDFDAALGRLRRLLLVLGACGTLCAVAVGPILVRGVFGVDGELGGRDMGMLAVSAVLLMVAVAEGQGVIALSLHSRFATGWLAAFATFLVALTFSDDLYWRVETALVASAAVALSWMRIASARGLSRRRQ